MKILVPIKQVAVLDEDFELRDDGRDVDPSYLDYELNEWDDFSWETALLIQEANPEKVEIIPLTIGPDESEDGLRRCLGKGGERGIRVWHQALEGSDPSAIARVIAKVAQREQVDMVFTGALAADHGYAQTGISLASQLEWPHVAVVSKLDLAPDAARCQVQRELEGGLEQCIDLACPAVLTIQLGINEPRYASLRGIKQAKGKPIELLTHTDLGLDDNQVGEAGSRSHVRCILAPAKGQAELIEGSVVEQAARLAEIIKQLQGEAA